MKLEENKAEARNQTPNDKETMRFVVLMRRFLAPASNLNYEKIWLTISKEFSLEIPQVLRERIESGIEELRKGQLPLKINNKNITAENIYQTISEGVFLRIRKRLVSI